MNEWRIEYNKSHDLEWLKAVISLATPDECICEYEKGYKRALKWVMELITEGMEE